MTGVLLGLVSPTSTLATTPETGNQQDGATPEVEPALIKQIEVDETTGYLIYFRDHPDLSPAQKMSWEERGLFVMNALQETAERSQANVRLFLDAQGVQFQAFWIDNIIAVDKSSRETFKGLMSFSEIESLRSRRTMGIIEPDIQLIPESILAVEPNITHVGAPSVWGLGYTGQGIVVSSVDTGVRYTHQALVNHYRGNLGGSTFDHNYNWWDPYGDHPASPADDNGHGSHTMGTMIGDDGGTNQIGMAPGAEWMACRGCNTSSCTDAALLACGQFMAAPTNLAGTSPDPSKRPNVVNNSWGDCSQTYDNWYQGVVDSWQAAGVYPVFSNGNASNCGYGSPPGLNTVGNPARYGNVTGVGSSGQSNGQYATHSNWGPTDNPDTINPRGYPNLKPQVLAPGVNIRSSVNSSDTAYEGGWSGTSMSAPHVSGLIALIWSAAPCLVGDYATTETLIEQNATPIPYASGGSPPPGPGNVPNYATGWGEINALAAVQAAMSTCGDSTLTGRVTESTQINAAGDPVSGALVVASNITDTRQTTTDAQGYYTMTLFAGTYDVSVSAYGFQTAVYPDFAVAGVTSLNLAVSPAAFYTVSGVVSDVNTTWPLYAKITIVGYPGAPIWTNPETGAYSISLAEGITYTFSVEAWVVGYLPGIRDVGPLTGDTTQNFALDVNTTTCNAPGYSLSLSASYNETFDSITPPALPAGWAVLDVSGTAGDWVTRVGTRYPSGQPAHSPPNLAFFNSYSASSSSSTRLNRTSGLDMTGIPNPSLWLWMYHDSGYSGSNDRVQVQVSTDGTTWADVGSPISRYSATPSWTQHTVDLSAYSAETNLQIGFLGISAYGNDVHIDDIGVGTLACTAPPGGLVVGNVYDDNTGNPLVGALVSNDSGRSFTAVATPDDPDVDDAFYTLYSPSGNHPFTASMPGYGSDVEPVTVVAGDTVRQDLYPMAGYLSTNPAALSANVTLGNSTILPLTLSNSGGGTASWEINEKDKGYIGTMADEDVLVVAHDTTAATAMETALTALGYSHLRVTDAQFQAMPVDDLLTYRAVFHAGTTGTSTPTASEAKLIAFLDAGGNLYISDNDLGYWRKGSVFYDTYLQSTYNADDGGTNLTGENMMAGLDLDITADPYPDDFTVGAQGTRIFKFTTSSFAGGVAVDRNGYKAIYTSFDFQYITPDNKEVELVQRVLGFLMPPDVPWLSESPITGTLPAYTDQLINVTFDASGVPQPGDYLADLIIKNNTPYGRLTVPVTMTVVPPATWGMLQGTVSGLGYCDSDPSLLNQADVFIESSTMTWTLKTNAAGYYSLWLDQSYSPLSITVTYPEYQTGTATGVGITGGITTTQDFSLRWLKPCVGVNPDSLSATVDMGASATLPLTITNTGASATNFDLLEQNRGFTPVLLLNSGGSTGKALPGSDKTTAKLGAPKVSEKPGVPPRTFTEIIQDGGFELGPSTPWDMFSSTFGTPLCDVASCGIGGGTAGPHAGTYWIWFGGATAYEHGYISQDVVIPAGTASLSFWLWIGTTGSPASDYMDAKIDGNVVFHVTADQQALYPSYTQVVVDVSAYADGNTHTVRFESEQMTSTVTNFNLDDVGLNASSAGNVIWLFENPVTGTLPADTGIVVVDVTLSGALVSQPGHYYATLLVNSDDPMNGSIGIPVTMTVNLPSNLGKLQGNVNGLGYCDLNPEALSGLDVVIEGATISYTTITDLNGDYVYWLDPAQNPFYVTVDGAAIDYSSATVGPLNITAQMTTTQNIDLRLLKPCVSVQPDSLEVAVPLGFDKTVPLTLVNSGAATTPFEITEKPGTPFAVSANPNSSVQPIVPGLPASIIAETGKPGNAPVTGTPSGRSTSPNVGAAWETMAPLPSGRVFNAVVADTNGFIYVIGGTSDAGGATPTDTNYRYNTANNSWDTMASLPTALSSIDGITINDKIYIPGDGTTATTYVYNIATNTWSSISANGGYNARAQYQVAAIGTDLYVLGGIVTATGASTTEVWVLDTTSGNWSTGVAMQKSRTAFSAGAIGDSIYVAGGVVFPGFVPDMTAEMFNGTAWSFIAGVPDGGGVYTRWSYNADGLGIDGLWLGAGRRDAGWAVLNHAGYYNPTSNTWTDSPTIPALSQGRVYMEGDVATDGYFYVIGGRDSAGATIYATNERLEVGYAGGSNDVPWLSENPITGTINHDSNSVVDVTFTAFPTMTIGTYTATLNIKTDDPINGSIGIPVTMIVATPVQADFSGTPTSGIAPLNVVFTNLSTGDFDTSLWDFGDGGTSNLANPSHVYLLGGVYTVTLTVSGLGGTDTEIKTSYITVVQADFSGTPTSGVAPLNVAFTNLSTGDFTSSLWDFGDGGTSTLANPTHNYTVPGVYTVMLTVSGPSGTDTETKTGYITVYTPAHADFSGAPTSGIAPLNVAFTNLSTGDFTSSLWNFGDGGTSNLTNPAHTYTVPGVYTVMLTVSGPGGTDTETKVGYITVRYGIYLPMTVKNSPGVGGLNPEVSTWKPNNLLGGILPIDVSLFRSIFLLLVGGIGMIGLWRYKL